VAEPDTEPGSVPASGERVSAEPVPTVVPFDGVSLTSPSVIT